MLIEDWSLCQVVGYLLLTEMLEREGISQIALINGIFQILAAEVYQGAKRDLLPYTWVMLIIFCIATNFGLNSF